MKETEVLARIWLDTNQPMETKSSTKPFLRRSKANPCIYPTPVDPKWRDLATNRKPSGLFKATQLLTRSFS